MSNTLRLILCCTLFTSSAIFCNLQRASTPLSKVARKCLTHKRAMSSLNNHQDSENDPVNNRIATLVGNVLGKENTELRQALNKNEDNKNILVIVKKIFRKKIETTLDNERAGNLELVLDHIIQMIEERDDNATI